MKKIAFIGCSKRKKRSPCIAEKLYQGDLFKKSLKYCRQEKFDEIYILSAKYGLLLLNDIISPYEMTLNNFSKKERFEWSEMIKKQISERKIIGEFFFFCANDYCEFFKGKKPLTGLRIGLRLQWFDSRIKKIKSGGFNL